MAVTEFRLSQKRARELVRDLARDSSNVVVPLEGGGKWEQTVSLLQVMKCLEEGELVGDPRLDNYGNWICLFRRLGAGIVVEVTAAVERPINGMGKIYVLEIKRE